MSNADLLNIKYYPDRFYISLDGFDLNNLTTFLTDLNIGQNQAVFIHEYYHYLTNITSYPGTRQFTLNFCDRFKAVTILGFEVGINAFPLNNNQFPNCKDLIDYWYSVTEIIDSDDLDYELAKETTTSANKSFETLQYIGLIADN